MSTSSATELEKTNDVFAIEIANATKLHLEYLILQMVNDFCKNFSFNDTRISHILDILLKTVAVKMLLKNSESLYETGFFTSGSSRLLK